MVGRTRASSGMVVLGAGGRRSRRRHPERMTTELDHVYVLTSVGAEAAARLAAFGLTEGSPNVHPGQGTACRRFFFENAYIELLWVTDTVEAQSETVAPTHLWERWSRRQQGGCPFGLAFRPSAPGLTALPPPVPSRKTSRSLTDSSFGREPSR